MKKECEELVLDLSAYIDGELTENSCQVIEKHLKICQDCRQLAHELEETGNMVKQAFVKDAEPKMNLDGVWEEIEARTDFGLTFWQKIRTLLEKPSIWIPTAVATTASALLIFSLTISKEPTHMELSRVESVYSRTGQVMVMQTASSGQPLIWILPEISKEASQ